MLGEGKKNPPPVKGYDGKTKEAFKDALPMVETKDASKPHVEGDKNQDKKLDLNG